MSDEENVLVKGETNWLKHGCFREGGGEQVRLRDCSRVYDLANQRLTLA